MYLTKTVSRLAASAAVLASVASASMAQQIFSYSTTFTPDPIPVNRPGQVAPEFIIDAIQGSGANVLTPTTINLTNFRLLDNPADPNNNGTFSFSQFFTIGLTITPNGMAGITQNITGTINGSVTRTGAGTGTMNGVTFTPTPAAGSLPLTYTFGNTTFTVFNPRYTSFGPVGSSTEGAIAVDVTSQVASIPEPSEYAAMGMAAFALCGLMIRTRRSKSGSIKPSGMMAA